MMKIEKIKDYWPYILIFVFFVILGLNVPFGGDDWEIARWYKFDFFESILASIEAHNYLNGRIFNNLFDAFFGFYNVIWPYISALIYVATVFIMAKIFNFEKNKLSIIIMLAALLSVSVQFRNEIQLHLIGNVSYTIATFLIFYIMYYLQIKNNNYFFQNKKFNYGVIFFLSFVASLWIENLTIALLALNIILIVDNIIKNKNLNLYSLFSFIGTVAGSLILFTSKGISMRIDQGTSGESILSTIQNNFFPVIDSLTFQMGLIWILFLIFLFYNIRVNALKIKNNRVKCFVSIGIFALLLMMLINGFLILFGHYFVNDTSLFLNYIKEFINIESDLLISKLIAMFLLLTPLVLIAYTQKKDRNNLLYIYIIAIISIGSILVSPGSRNLIIAIYAVILFTGYLASNIKFKSSDAKKIFVLIITIFLFLRVETYANILIRANKITHIRKLVIENYIEKQFSNEITSEDWLILPMYDEERLLKNFNQMYYKNAIIKYYMLKENSNIMFDDGFRVIDFKVKKISPNEYKFTVNQLALNEKFSYNFQVYEKDIMIFSVVTDYPEYLYFSNSEFELDYRCQIINSNNEIIEFEGIVN